MKTLTINKVNFKIKNSFGAIMEFEKRTKKKVALMDDSITDTITLLYCMLNYNNKESFHYSFEQFIEELDNDNSIMEGFTQYLIELQQEQINQLEEDIKKKMELLKLTEPVG